MKRFVAGALTLLVMTLVLRSGSRREPTQAVPPEPENTAAPEVVASGEPAQSPAELRVRGLLKDSVSGDVSAYLDAFSGTLRRRLEREVNERGRDAFADDLRRAAKSRKSHAVFAAEPEGNDAARVTVETVYPDRNERQTYRVERTETGWLVAEVETVRSSQPKAKFGTSASYIAPEGVPVQGAVRVETGDGPDPTAGEDATGNP
jgi:hypothetical protein